ncbi:MAG TPA: ATP-grasp domain-containing protein [Actinoplanes sp.]|nr:ATP-grasp domain-containing protein [Actinoplanes sp.]
MLLIPADVVRPRRPDEHFAAEARAARDAGVEVVLIEHDFRDAEAAVARVPDGAGDLVYRGWMFTADRYAALAGALAARGASLRTGAAQYRQAHELPGWYATAAAAGVTPLSTWTTGDDPMAFREACAGLGGGPAVLRDWTKSMKHHWHEAAYIPDTGDPAAAWTVAARFRELRGDDFTGGFVVRSFEQFQGAEVRTWWLAGACRLVTAHPDTPDDLPPDDVDLSAVAGPLAELALPFVTADLTRHRDGRWRLVEIGDGQVSDRPRTTTPEALIGALGPVAPPQ